MIAKIREAIAEETALKERLERLARRIRAHHMPVAATASATAPVHDMRGQFVREPAKERAQPLSAPFPVFGKKKVIETKHGKIEVSYDPKKGVIRRHA